MILEWKGLPVIPSKSAADEMYREKLLIHDIVEILENGYDCARSRRGADVYERCVDTKNKTLKVVVARSYNYDLKSEVWVVTHVGMFTRR
ncbi:MAG: hypothetical protein V3T58_02690 [Candidatus Hydrothermarchaeales archaeon]